MQRLDVPIIIISSHVKQRGSNQRPWCWMKPRLLLLAKGKTVVHPYPMVSPYCLSWYATSKPYTDLTLSLSTPSSQPPSAEVDGDDDDDSKKGAAIGRLLQTFASIRSRFGEEFLNVLLAVHGLQQFKLLLSGSLGNQPRAECIHMLVGGCDGGSIEALCSMGCAPLIMEVVLDKDDQTFTG